MPQQRPQIDHVQSEKCQHGSIHLQLSTHSERQAFDHSLFGSKGVRELNVLEVNRTPAVGRALHTIIVSVSDDRLQTGEPKVVIGGRIGLGET
jgi:hypothetical protein